MAEAVEEPGGAGGFAEGWGGDADEFELPVAELRLVEVQPVEGAVDGGEGGEAGDAALSGGGGGIIFHLELSARWRWATVCFADPTLATMKPSRRWGTRM